MTELYNRTFFWVFILDIPHLRGKELMSAVKIKLGSLYPADIQNTNIQIRKNGTKKGSYLIFVLNKNTGSKILPLSLLFTQYLYSNKNANVLFLDRQWLEFIRIENGAVKSTIVKSRNEDTLTGDIKTLCADEENLVFFCSAKDKNNLEDLNNDYKIQYFDKDTELKKIDIHKISLFPDKSPVIKRQRVLLCVSFLFVIILSSWMFFQYHKTEQERLSQLRLEQEQRRNEEQERQRETQMLSELKRQYKEIITNKTTTPFDISIVISECANVQTRIQSAAFNGNFFQIEGSTVNSLELLHNFENHHMVNNARLHQVNPVGNRDTFTLSGTVLIKEIIVDETLPGNEQIIIYENLISLETDYSVLEAQLSPSAFAGAVNSLFSKWGCSIRSFQFMNEPQRTELEIHLRGTGNSFFNALYEIKTKHRLWDVHLTQIRNLYPQNMLDIVVRIRTEYLNPKQDNTDYIPPDIYIPFPVSNISRNYFMASPVTRPVASAGTVEQVPVTSPLVIGERVTWLEYIGSVHEEDEGRFIYVKDTRTGRILKLNQQPEGNMRYSVNQQGSIIAYINENIYEITRR